ncbi:MAG: ATP-binding protein [Pirellulales bacterium]
MSPIVHSLFEEGYLRRDLGAVADNPEIAIAELVANAWDAGASQVHVTIPDEVGGRISVADNGVGMTAVQFRERWMKHGYLRVKHQGELAEFPPERKDWVRKAYGRNGIGRHGLLCFADKYDVETRPCESAEGHCFTVQPSSGDSAFDLTSDRKVTRKAHGTTLSAIVEYKLPNPEQIAESLSFKFMYDPQFVIHVNGNPITLEDFEAIASKKIKIDQKSIAEVVCIRAPVTKRWRSSHGVAFWIGGRLVGEPSYGLHGISLLDGRTAVANQHMFIVKSDHFFDDIEPDWTNFKKTLRTEALATKVGAYITSLVGQLMADRIQENKTEALRNNREDIQNLRPLAKIEITEFLDTLASEHPTLNTDVLSSAVKAAVNLEKSRSGQALLEKLAVISEDDADALNQLLDSWTTRDALIVLDEIDRRMSVVSALEKLMADVDSDELHSIHPLVSQARWLFGPEFDSPIFSSNVTIRAAAEKVFKKRIDAKAIAHPRSRPDLIFLKDATLGMTGTECFDDAGTVTRMETLLLIELKKGNSTIGVEEMQQAERYVNDLLDCGLLDGPPYIRAFVAGHKMDRKARVKTLGEQPVVAKIEAVTYGQLVRTAKHRLFKLQEHIGDRYKDVSGIELVDKVLKEPRQGSLFEEEQRSRKRTRKRVRK